MLNVRIQLLLTRASYSRNHPYGHRIHRIRIGYNEHTRLRSSLLHSQKKFRDWKQVHLLCRHQACRGT
jgi:hypothetical protein